MAKNILIDRKHPEVALAEINALLNRLEKKCDSLETQTDNDGGTQKVARESITSASGTTKDYTLTSGGIYFFAVGEVNASAEIGTYFLIPNETTANLVELSAASTASVSMNELTLSVSFAADNYELALYML